MLTFLFAVGLVLASLCPISGFAQVPSEKVWAVVAFTLHGDSTPSILRGPKTLTSYGAEQLYSAGSAFRDRYVAVREDGNDRIQDISAYALDSDEIDIFSTDDQCSIASAQAFMQGLYPPLDISDDDSYTGDSSMSTDESATYNTSGYQYPRIITLGAGDLGVERVSGYTECPLYEASRKSYETSREFRDIAEQSAKLYSRVYDIALSDVLHPSHANYANSPDISDYLQYGLLHNSTLLDRLDEEDISQARILADQYVYATNSNTSSWVKGTNDDIRMIAGQTLASFVLNFFDENIRETGLRKKMALLFGHYQPPVALASLLQLVSLGDADFGSRPTNGASVAFELCSLENETFPAYPDMSNTYVRFLVHNGTDSSTDFIPYPLFGHDAAEITIGYMDFREELKEVSLSHTDDWCTACNSSAVFCYGVLSSSAIGKAIDTSRSPTFAAMIGVYVAFAIAVGTIVIMCIVIYIISRNESKSSMGGFKGADKMASDCDVTHGSPRENREVASDSSPDDGGSMGAGICSGSWEMDHRMKRGGTDVASVRGTETVCDDETEEWRLHSKLEPTRVQENV